MKHQVILKFVLYTNLIILNICLICNIFIISDSNTKQPIDYSINKDLEKCYITIHNFVTYNYSNNIDENLQFKTYIYSYTKPFLLELTQNSTKDCLCCK